MTLVGASGELVTIDRKDGSDELAGAVVACGALGVVTELELDVVPSFEMRQTVYERLPLAAAIAHLDELLAAAYSVSLFVEWAVPHVSQVWLKERLEPGLAPAPKDVLGARPADGPRHPITGWSAESCTEQMGVPGPWHERLPHFRADYPPSAAGDELQSEYFVDRARAPEAIEALAALAGRLAPLVRVSEVRSVAPDGLWLSPSCDRAKVGLHFTWVHDLAGVLGVLGDVEAALAPFGARPHWGKLFATSPEIVRARYGRLGDFQALLERLDPAGKFAGPFVERYLAPAGRAGIDPAG